MEDDTPIAPATPAVQPDNSGDLPETRGLSNSKAIWMGTAVGIGSAAIVAALLYSKRRKG